MERFAEEKAAVLEEWEARKTTLVRPAAKGGYGYVDPDIVPLCDALNRLDGAYTLQSCAGHRAEDSDGPVYPGHLWLRLDRELAHRFEQRAEQLAAEPLIDRVEKIYWPDGKQTICLSFKGNEAGRLAESSATILNFFRNLHP